MRMLTASLLLAAMNTTPALADSCGDLAAKFADEDKRDTMTIGEMDELRLCVGEWMRDQILQRSKGNKQSSNDARSGGFAGQTAFAAP